LLLPAYQDYTKRAHVSEGLSLAAGAKSAIIEFKSDRNLWPVDNAEAGLVEPDYIKGNAVVSVTVSTDKADGESGKITILYNEKVNGQDLVLEGKISATVDEAGSFTWDCTGGGANPVLAKWRPARCR
jgi:type IV pilus assembly protein PilA